MAGTFTRLRGAGSAALAVVLGACATPQVVPRIRAATPGATYEGVALGCDVHFRRGGERQHFGENLRRAVLWSRQVVGAARALPCEAVIVAVTDRGRVTVYRVAWTEGGRTEEVFPREY